MTKSTMHPIKSSQFKPGFTVALKDDNRGFYVWTVLRDVSTKKDGLNNRRHNKVWLTPVCDKAKAVQKDFMRVSPKSPGVLLVTEPLFFQGIALCDANGAHAGVVSCENPEKLLAAFQ